MGSSVPATSNDTKEAHGFLELNDRPAAWDEVTLGDLFTFKNGLNKAKRYFGSGVPIVNYMDVFQRPGIRLEDLSGRVELTLEEIESYEVRRGDVFFTRTSETIEDIGIASVMLDNPESTVFSGFVLRARPLSNLIGDRYKQYCFASRSVRSQIVSGATYTTRALTNGKVLSNVRIAIPPAPEQEAIAEVLSDIDSLINSLGALIAKKQAIKQATMQHLLTGKTRLPGFRGNWTSINLGKIGSTYGGLTGKRKVDFQAGESRFLTFVSVLANVILDRTHTSGVHVGLGESQNPVLKGDLVFNTTSETPQELAMGAVMGNQVDNLYLNSFCFGFRIYNRSIHLPIFLAYFFRGSPGRTVMSALAQGTTRYNMSQRQFLALEITIPEYSEQVAIAAVLSDMDNEINALQRRLEKTQAIKQGMMQELLSGRVRLVAKGAEL